MVKASKIFYVAVLAWLFLPTSLAGMFSRTPRFPTMIRGVLVEEPKRRSLSSLALTPQAKALVARPSVIKKLPHNVSSRDLKGLGKPASPAKNPVAVAVGPMKVMAVHVDERTMMGQSTLSTQPQQPAVASKEVKQAVTLVQADEKRPTEQSASVAKPNKTINVASPEYLVKSLRDMLQMPTETAQGVESLLVSALQQQDIGIDMVRNSKGQTALHLAADDGGVSLADVLLRAGATVSAQDKNGLTPLHVAAYNGDADMVGLLLKYDPEATLVGADFGSVVNFGKVSAGCYPYESQPYGLTPLHWLLYNRPLRPMQISEVANLLIQAMAGIVWIPDTIRGRLPIHYASQFGLIGIVRLLIHSVKTPKMMKIMVNTQDCDGCTPLHDAALSNRGDVVVELLRAGASVKVRNKHSQTPRELTNDDKITALLERVENDPSMSLENISLEPSLLDWERELRMKDWQELMRKVLISC